MKQPFNILKTKVEIMKKIMMMLVLALILVLIPNTDPGALSSPVSERRLELEIPIKETEEKPNQLDLFLNELAFKESSGRWKVTNRYGYIGKYQFGKLALMDLDLYPRVNAAKFKKDPSIFPEDLQDSVVIKFMKMNADYLEYYLTKYRNDSLNGIYINDAGILSAAHLVGKGNMRKFFRSGGTYMPKDGNGVTAGDYIKHFSKFDFIVENI